MRVGDEVRIAGGEWAGCRGAVLGQPWPVLFPDQWIVRRPDGLEILVYEPECSVMEKEDAS